MGREVRVTNQAARDLACIAERQRAIGSVEQAQSALRTINRAIRNLVFTPLGSPWRAEIGARERLAAGHMIIYDVEPAAGTGPCAGDVTVLHIFDPALDRDLRLASHEAAPVPRHENFPNAVANIPQGVY